MMFDIFLNLNKREKNLIILALVAVCLFVVFLLSKNIIDSYSLSSQKLLKAKNDYEYVISKAELLNSSLISNSTDVNQIEAYIKDLFSNPANDLKVENLKESLRISFRTNNIKDAVTISDEIAKNLQRQLTKISYSKDEQDTLVELYFINF